MIKIVKNGREKTFRERCHECATEYDYNIDDVIEIEDKTASLPFMRRIKFVPCPVCGEHNPAALWTVEDWGRFDPRIGGGQV